MKREGSTGEERWDVEINEKIAIRSHTYDGSRYQWEIVREKDSSQDVPLFTPSSP